jgi:ABC-2 type transport system ATP-binding protein
MTTSNALVVTDLRRAYGDKRALDGVSFALPAGSLCGLVGPNGAGKTTLLSILATLDEDFDGDASIAQCSVRDAPLDVRRRLGFVPDHAPLYDALTVAELLRFFAAAADVPRARRESAVDEVVELCGLRAIASRPAAGLSKGQTQRVSVARALLHDPDVLLLDEPASGLDPRARIELKELLKRLTARDKTVLVSSHILTELGEMCDSVVMLEQGKVAYAGRIDALAKDVAGSSASSARRVLIEIARASDVERAQQLLIETTLVRDVVVEGRVLQCIVDGPRTLQAKLVRALIEANVDVVEIAAERLNLEALFLTVTRGGPTC